jgi:hypothetical protein
MRAQDGLRVLHDPTADREALESAMQAMPVTGKAGLIDTLETAVGLGDAISAKSDVRVAVLYVSDSDVRNYREDFTNPVINSSDSRDLSRRFPEGLIRERISKLSDRLARYQTPVFIVHLRYSSERLNEAYQSGLLQIASDTGGAAIFCRSSADVKGAIERTLTAARSQHSIIVELPPKAPKTVNLTLSSGDRSLNYRSRFVLR